MTKTNTGGSVAELIAGVSIGDCVHVAGILNFLKLAESTGYRTEFIGAAKSPEEVAAWAKANRPDILAIGYRLDPDAAGRLFQRLKQALVKAGLHPHQRLVFGGTPPVAEVARSSGLFERAFSGVEDISEIVGYLKGETRSSVEANFPNNLVDRVLWKAPYPLLRHHFGLPSVEATRSGIEKIADAQVLDVISIGPDQNAQENFFHPEDMDHDQEGSGGVPVRSPGDFELLYQASRRGNYPLMRCYSGTRDVIRFGEMLRNTINNAWTAIPLCWYNVLDRRGPRGVDQSITEAQEAIAWHAAEGVPVEVNEAHHWSLRDAPDVVAVAAAYLGALNAKYLGVRDYVAQYMFNTPPGTTPAMDLGKMLAKLELIESLADDGFRIWRQVRAGLASFPADLDMAKGHLAASTLVSMNLKPHIVHVVGFCEGDHAATPGDIIESCKIVQGVIGNCMDGMPDMTLSGEVQARKNQLIEEAMVLLRAIAELPEIIPELLGPAEQIKQDGPIPGAASEGPEPVRPVGQVSRLNGGDQVLTSPTLTNPALTNPRVLSYAIKVGLLDAPHLIGNPAACGQIRTAMIGGACVTIDPESGGVLPEAQRVERILDSLRRSRGNI
ncbi:MAG TPA: cobalamin B12-binding domain-containing protein [Firmicutes bacterium]|jgi:methylmalonyl-CoA mutase cobalamin-binding subunit|nr:cobalamin B12-binding domain-containing protein [Candidatus Fermentithermobacillaceae bacterium]